MFKKVATLQFRKIYASDSNGKYYWRDFVKQANSQPMTDANFVPKNFYEYDTKNFLYITARAISGMEKWGCNGNFDAFPWKELQASFPTFCGKGFYIEHKEDDEMDAKGIILDAQPDEDNEFINCICAISKQEYPDICEQILNGQLNQVSMSCLAAECECSKCHNVATKEEELCEHMNPKHPNFCKGQTDEFGKPIYEINKNIVFTGLSGVAVPADKDAFIFDVKASKKQNSKTINKEYNKYCRAKKEYEYINSLLEKEDTRKYIESQLKKQAGYTYKEISNIGYEEGAKDGAKYKETGETQLQTEIDKNLKELKVKYEKDEDMGSYILKEWDSFIAGYTNGFSDGWTGHIEKKAFQDIKGESWEDVLNKISELGYEFDEHYYDEPYKFITVLKDNKEYKIKLFGYNNGSYEVISIVDTGKTYKDLGDFLVNSSLNKKADVEYMSDTIKEIPPIDFETEFMLAGKSKGVNTDINKDQLEIGIKVEMEHTTNPVIAEKIAMDHIKEIPNYYTLLAEMEAKAKFEFEQAKDIINKETNEELPETTIQANKKITIKANNQFFKIQHINNKQFFKVKKANKNWFKIANINDDPEDRNDIDKYGLSQLERETIADTVHTINITNPESFITWTELEESIPQDIIDYDTLERKQQQIIDFIVNELKQDIDVY